MGYQRRKTRKAMHAAKLQREAVPNFATALERKFYACGEELERVEVCKYLGRLVSFEGGDTQAVRSNLKKARRCWARISRVLGVKNAYPRVCYMFYKATGHAILIFGVRHGVCLR